MIIAKDGTRINPRYIVSWREIRRANAGEPQARVYLQGQSDGIDVFNDKYDIELLIAPVIAAGGGWMAATFIEGGKKDGEKFEPYAALSPVLGWRLMGKEVEPITIEGGISNRQASVAPSGEVYDVDGSFKNVSLWVKHVRGE